jgi:hypothetical protein
MPKQIKRYTWDVSKSYNATTGLQTIDASFKVNVGNDSAEWVWDWCTKDAVTVDGLGLPTPHACGDSTIPWPVPNDGYLG